MQNFYTILKQTVHPSDAEFIVELQADCAVYAGHFLGNPIAPGACNIEMVRQCISLAKGREMRIAAIQQCKFIQLIHMHESQLMTIKVTWVDTKYSASIWMGNQMAVQLKMILV